MSGGYFDYEDYKLSEWANMIDNHEEFRKLLLDISKLLHSYDYAISGDTNMNDFEKEYNKFKEGF